MLLMHHYNIQSQPYSVVSRFTIQEEGTSVGYARIKFLHTGHEQVVSQSQLLKGDFVDESLLEESSEQVVEPKKLDAPQKPIATSKKVEIEKPIVAIDPKGDKMVVPTANLEQFCKNNELDVEIVKTVLEGKQKTHKRWKFIYA